MLHQHQTGSIDSPWVKAGVGTWDLLQAIGTTFTVEPDAVIFNQGGHSDSLYCLKDGRVKVVMFGVDGSEKTLAIHESGSLFGETSALDNLPQLATAIAMKRSEIIRVHVNSLRTLFQEDADVALRLLQSLCRKIRLLVLQVEGMAFLDVEKRIANILVKLSIDFGVPTPEGIRLSVRMTDQELANIVGSCRVTVTKVLNLLRRQGLIHKADRYLVITDPNMLMQFAMGLPYPEAPRHSKGAAPAGNGRWLGTKESSFVNRQ